MGFCEDESNATTQTPTSSGITDTTETGSSPCCWCSDYETEVNTDGPGTYYRRYNSSGVPQRHVFRHKYTLEANLNSRDITVLMKLGAVNKGVSASEFQSATTKMITGIAKYWNGKAKMVLEDPECKPLKIPINFRVEYVTSSPHRTLEIHKDYPTPAVDPNSKIFLNASSSEWTYAHEFGHAFGLPDEYGYKRDQIESVKYKLPDMSWGSAIAAPHRGKAANAADANIMSTSGHSRVYEQHFWCIAIETQKLLKSKGKQVKCSIKL